MLKKLNFYIISIVFLLTLFQLPLPLWADLNPPLIPATYWGSVTYTNGDLVKSGTIEALVDGIKYGEIILNNGVYGGPGPGDPKLIVSGINGQSNKTVHFRVNGYEAIGTVAWLSGDVKRVDLQIVSSGFSISGHVSLQNVSGYAGGVQVRLINQLGVTSNATLTDDVGNYAFSNVPPADYTLTASKPVYLTCNPVSAKVTTGDCLVTEIKLLTGDVNCNNKVDIADLTGLRILYGQAFECEKPEDWIPHEDLNRDNKVDLRDLLLLVRNYGQKGY